MIGKIVEAVDGIIKSTVGKLITDKDLGTRLESELSLKIVDQVPGIIKTELLAKKDVLLAELGGESWLQRNWRPILMLCVVAIIVNNYILFPYLSLFTSKALLLDLPTDLWKLMKIGVGGYIVGRSGEKMVKGWKSEGRL